MQDDDKLQTCSESIETTGDCFYLNFSDSEKAVIKNRDLFHKKSGSNLASNVPFSVAKFTGRKTAAFECDARLSGTRSTNDSLIVNVTGQSCEIKDVSPKNNHNGHIFPIPTQNQTGKTILASAERNYPGPGTLQPLTKRQSFTAQYRNVQHYPNVISSYQFSHLSPVAVSSSQQNRSALHCFWWGSGGQSQHQRRSIGLPNLLTFGVHKNCQRAGAQIQQPNLTTSKFQRNILFLDPTDQSSGAEQMNLGALNNTVKPFGQGLDSQDQSVIQDTAKFHSLENQMLDMRRTDEIEQQQINVAKKNLSNLGGQDADDENNEQCSARTLAKPALEKSERFSRKVFVGGLPPDIDEDEITAAFGKFGPLVVDWPHKTESKSYFPPKGYCFLIFQDEISVQNFIEMCLVDDEKLYWCVSSPTMKDKPVQIRPWTLGDSDFVMDGSQPLDPRKTIFVGGVPRPLRAVELAMILDRLYGGVCYAGIDTDPELKYPKGAGRVAFSNQQSYIAAISARFVQLQHGDIDKRVEVKPYVLDDQMCDECHGSRCAGKFAPFFCANVTCLQYYCEHCWAQIHARLGREFHKPLVKEGADRPRAVPFRWC